MPGALGLVSGAGVAVAAAADLLLGPVNDAQMQHQLSVFYIIYLCTRTVVLPHSP